MGGGGGKGGGGAKTGQADPNAGITPEQAALAQYTFGENVLGDRAQFAKLGMGPSTAETQAVGGSRFKEVEDAAKMQHQDYLAMAQFDQAQNQAKQQQAGQAGSLLGSLGGGGGGGGGSSMVG